MIFSGNISAKLDFIDGTSTLFSLSMSEIILYYAMMGSLPLSLSSNLSGDIIHVRNEAKVWKYETGTYWHVVTNQLD
ncbi:hypothetical protein [Spiroplasma endosymbiont of Nebria brevicollis]|uniref:hypothetical protein n=1 Tax=Spiroplasma endosymbiont of Nebria brevicollis TaxID=3066284 RepID=UPI00313F052B